MVARIVAEQFLDSEIEIEDFNARAASVYLAVNVDRDELMRDEIIHLIPARIHS